MQAVDPREPGVARAAVLALARPMPAALAVPGAGGGGRGGREVEKEGGGEEEAEGASRGRRGHRVYGRGAAMRLCEVALRKLCAVWYF